MDTQTTIRFEPGGDGHTTFRSRPPAALPGRARAWVFGTLAGLTLGVAGVFALFGYWLVLPFAGLEAGVLGWAMWALREQEAYFESLSIEGDTLTVAWRDASGTGMRRFNRLWVRVDCVCAARGHNCRLTLWSAGQATELGRFLADTEREALATALRARLRTG